ncbi:MAG: hypothetical protein MHM6MM_000938 [Cercozoa sp. M6MM]
MSSPSGSTSDAPSSLQSPENGASESPKEIRGFIYKKNPRGVVKRIWKKRFVIAGGAVAPSGLVYFMPPSQTPQDDSELEECGRIPFVDISDVVYVRAKKPIGCRFDVHTSKRVYVFRAANPHECHQWVVGLKALVQPHRTPTAQPPVQILAMFLFWLFAAG